MRSGDQVFFRTRRASREPGDWGALDLSLEDAAATFALDPQALRWIRAPHFAVESRTFGGTELLAVPVELPPMNQEEAERKAVLVFGYDGMAGPRTSREAPECRCYVGRYRRRYNPATRERDRSGFETLGIGRTYEEAFADALRKGARS